MGKQQKPFLAARIPAGLEAALEKHTKSTGESKTAAIISALSAYIGWKPDLQGSEGQDRLSQIEARLTELEKRLELPQQKNLLELSVTTIPDTRKSKTEQKPKIDNKENRVINQDTSENKDGKLFTHGDIAKIANLKYSTVKARRKAKRDNKVRCNGRVFEPVSINNSWQWKEITSDNDVIQHPGSIESLS